MNRPVLQVFMILCAVFWTVIFLLPFFAKPKPDEVTAGQVSRSTHQTTALGMLVVSWAGVIVLRMGKAKGKAAGGTA